MGLCHFIHRALISDVLDLSKIEAGRMEIETVPFDLREELDNILSFFEEKVHQNKLEISSLVHDSVPQWMYGDPGRLRQVLINLVGNAIKVHSWFIDLAQFGFHSLNLGFKRAF